VNDSKELSLQAIHENMKEGFVYMQEGFKKMRLAIQNLKGPKSNED